MTLDPDVLRGPNDTAYGLSSTRTLMLPSCCTPVTISSSRRVESLTKAEYLGSIASGELNYSVFEPVSEIAVWGDDQIALLRYQARIAFHDPQRQAPLVCWHTDCYELREGTGKPCGHRPRLSTPADGLVPRRVLTFGQRPTRSTRRLNCNLPRPWPWG